MDYEALKFLVSERKSTREIAEIFEVSQTTIRYWLIKYDLHTCWKGTSRSPQTNSTCIVCGDETKNRYAIYCSNKCQGVKEYRDYIERWKTGQISGLTKAGIVSETVKKYLRLKYNDACTICGWSKMHPITGTVPLVADHIDGNWKNNCEDNLRLLCGCCDSLTPTYKGLNRGNGRSNRL